MSDTDKLRNAGQDALKALGSRAVQSIEDRVGSLTDRLEGLADGQPLKKAVVKGAEAKAEGGSGLMGGLKGAASGIKDKVTGVAAAAGVAAARPRRRRTSWSPSTSACR